MFRCTQALVRTNTVPVSSVRLVLDLLPIQPFQYLKGKTAQQERHCAGEGPFFPLHYSPKDGSGAHDHSVRAGVDS